MASTPRKPGAREIRDAETFPESAPGVPRREADGGPALRICTADQFKAMSSPVRDQIMNVVANMTTFDDDGRALGVSVREIGEQLCRKPASLYRHIDALAEAGLIVKAEPADAGGRDAVTYVSPGKYIVLVPPREVGPELDAMGEYIMSVAANAGRETTMAARDRVTLDHAIGPNDTGGAVIRGWLDEDQRAELRRLQHEINVVFSESRRRPGTRLMAATFLFRPTRLPGGSIADEQAVAAEDDDRPT
jgi:hypothetical protein